MKVVNVSEAQGRLSEIIYQVSQGESIVLKDGEREVTLTARRSNELDLEEDSPELEAELLKGAKGPFKPYSREELRSVVQKAVADELRGEPLCLSK